MSQNLSRDSGTLVSRVALAKDPLDKWRFAVERCNFGLCLGKSQLLKVQSFYEVLNNPDGIILIHIVFQGVAQKTRLIPVVSFDMPYKNIPASRDAGVLSDWRVFSQNLFACFRRNLCNDWVYLSGFLDCC
jgi:hypothetical protein